MRRIGVLVLALFLPGLAAADSLTIEVWPSADPTKTIYCAITLSHNRFSALQVIGHGAPAQPLRWYSTESDIAAMTSAWQSLIGGELAGQVILTSRTPPPPYVSVTWVANVDNATASGIYIQPGVTLPDVVLQAVLTVLPGGLCARHLAP